MALSSSVCLPPLRTSIALCTTTIEGSNRNCFPRSFSFTAISKISCTRMFGWLGLSYLFQAFGDLEFVKGKQADIQSIRQVLGESKATRNIEVVF